MDAHGLEPTVRDLLHETLDVELGPHPVWAGSPAARRVAERKRSRWPLRALAAAAAVLVVAIGGYQFLPGGSGSGGSNAMPPPPRPPLLARGVFDTARGRVGLAAIAEGSSVTGHMGVSQEGGGDASYSVDLQCTRTTEDGLIKIGGVTTETNGSGSVLSPVGTWAGIVLKRGSPVEADLWALRGGHAAALAASCLEFLDDIDGDRGRADRGICRAWCRVRRSERHAIA